MRLKYYLRGLGLGIIFTVVILSISGNLNKKNEMSASEVVNSENDTNKVVADKTNKEDKNSSITKEKKDKNNTSTENEHLNNNITSENASEANGGITDENLQQNQSESVSQQEQAQTNENITQDIIQPDATTQIITINVRQGEYCRPVAQKLQDAGLIADAEDFRIYMGNIGYASNIHSGDFEIPIGSTYEEIANILVRK